MTAIPEGRAGRSTGMARAAAPAVTASTTTWFAPPTPADLVTGFRGLLILVAGGLVVAALVAGEPARTWPVVWLCIAGWALDGVDGWVARRTGTVSERGALFDSGADGVLVLVLSLVHVPGAPWALLGGLLWPLFVLVQTVRPAWRRTLPHSVRRKLAGGTLTGTLAIAGAPFWPEAAVQVAVALAVALVTWSFAVDVRWLERAAVAPRRSTS
ncbi:phosphatidylglycerophosphate synthase [Ornithinimicrobium humiphilum]|uniref:Phosphatidylglycerophosphate synthase n=1 Tax=Ornithinimicrobium humiphilum TaxID=125288 RepID=A0A543KJP3_9MICO|nr:phosphatidylglycerophosphate synthase [Ornithinimicrobium humiphilum]